MITYQDLNTAFHHVKSNRGCAGVDGVNIGMFEARLWENLSALEAELADGRYRPLPLLRIEVDKGKGDGETRSLSIPVVRDRVAQTAVLQQIEPILEKEFESCSFAYRKGRSVRQAVLHIKALHEQGYRWVVDADIDAFFDSVAHDLLLEKVRRYIDDETLVALIGLWVRAEIWDGQTLGRIEKGIPQGSPISPILANLFLDELDEAMLGKGFAYVRYADDFILLARDPGEATDALELSRQVLERLHLELDEADIVSFDQGFSYLGVLFLKSLIMTPFDRPKKKQGVVYWPPPFDLQGYLEARKTGER